MSGSIGPRVRRASFGPGTAGLRVDQLLRSGQPLLHASARLPAQWFATAPILPVAEHPLIRSQWVVWNLREDPRPFLDLDEDTLADLLWTPASDLPEGYQRLPIKLIRANRCPMLSPMTVLDQASARRLAINPASVDRHIALLRRHQAFGSRLGRLFAHQRPGPAQDPELDLYGGFVPRPDLPLRDRIQHMNDRELAALDSPFSDERLNVLLFRYRARHWPDSLSEEERAEWARYRRRRLLDDPDLASIQLADYLTEIRALALQHPDRGPLWQALAAWPITIGLIDRPAEYQQLGTES